MGSSTDHTLTAVHPAESKRILSIINIFIHDFVLNTVEDLFRLIHVLRIL